MALDTLGGSWKANTYQEKNGGCEIELEFEPNKQVNAQKIGLIQSNERVDKGRSTDALQKSTLDDHNDKLDRGEETWLDDARKARGERTTGKSHIDRGLESTNPVYGAPSPSSGKISKTKKGKFDHSEEAKAQGKMQNYQIGYNYKKLGKRHNKSAKLYDAPFGTVNEAGKTSSMHFEVAAVALSGSQKGTYYGSVKWGYDTTDGTVTLVPLQVVTMGTPTPEFMAAGRAWNQAHDRGRNENLAMPITDHATIGKDDLNDRGRVTAAIANLEQQLEGDDIDATDKANLKFELKQLKQHLRTLD